MTKTVDAINSKTSAYTQFGGDAIREPDILIDMGGHSLRLRHVGIANTGFFGDGDAERPVTMFTADQETGRGQIVYLSPEEARAFGASLTRLADAAFRDKEKQAAGLE